MKRRILWLGIITAIWVFGVAALTNGPGGHVSFVYWIVLGIAWHITISMTSVNSKPAVEHNDEKPKGKETSP
jgi:hypothetical protein